ncbi:multi-copper oxidase laccase-like protein [Melampsora larici-populina 98AG31]|uniref:Multi-copper oxidase laccase-like protein n=1 Tax=Melampsora larici-populina (strain 98AG31 / pathotype 3-4-7) TaxID=747676 RepID=F4RRN3_MELLP|nr:multi-copper oxidase laccase-like protein [Melampsora larici-populina 98AG31]EGG04955.1 multi-copper oxidase laccase-like protein [Melampsora larici-populina 98AG31]
MINHFGLLLLLMYGVIQDIQCHDTKEAVAPRKEYKLDCEFEVSSKKRLRKYEWIVTNTTGAPDGFWRSVLAINNQMPGPLIEANEGDDVEVTVINKLDSPLTIHWHGLYQNGTNWEDGISGITQCPIPAGVTYTYKFTLANQYGTFWYHAHYQSLKTDGLVGPLVVHSPRDPLKRGIDFDEEIVLLLQDWYHTPSNVIDPQMRSTQGYMGFPSPPSANSALINGIGQWDCRFALTDDRCRKNSPPEFHLVAGTKTRFRLIQAGSHAMFFFSADEHTLNVTEADATPVHGPPAIHRVKFHNGQRYSVILSVAANETGTSFFLRASMDPDCWVWVTSDLQKTAFAIIRVVDATTRTFSTKRPTSRDWADRINGDCRDLDPNTLVPIIPVRVPQTVDGAGALAVGLGFRVFSTGAQLPTSAGVPSSNNSRPTHPVLQIKDIKSGIVSIPPPGTNTTLPSITVNAQVTSAPAGAGGAYFVNNVTWQANQLNPVLHDFAAGGPGRTDNSKIASVVYPTLGWYDLYLVNLEQATNHPFHLHGPEMHIVAIGTGTPTPENLRNLTYSTQNPLRRDTIFLQGGTYAVIRLRTDLPGIWAVHCHIQFHLADGFLGMIVIQPDKIKNFKIPPKTRDLCKTPIPSLRMYADRI